jgi:competence protein ComEC
MNRFNRQLIGYLLSILLLFSIGCANKQPSFHPTTSIPGLTIAPTTTPPSITSPTGILFVHFIDVGQGDAILIDYGTTEILIDGGERSPGVVSYVQRYIDGDLEVMVATHPHADHIGGLIAVFDAFKVDGVWYNGATYTSGTYQEFAGKMNSEGAVIRVGKRGDIIAVGGLSLSVLNPTNVLSGDINEDSMVLKLVYGSQSFLFTGDAGIVSEASLMAAGLDLKAQVLKVGHHGSYSASSPAFLAQVRPEIAIYMAGTGNTYGHPHQVTIDALKNISVTIYGTDVNGSIIVATDGLLRTITITKPN